MKKIFGLLFVYSVFCFAEGSVVRVNENNLSSYSWTSGCELLPEKSEENTDLYRGNLTLWLTAAATEYKLHYLGFPSYSTQCTTNEKLPNGQNKTVACDGQSCEEAKKRAGYHFDQYIKANLSLLSSIKNKDTFWESVQSTEKWFCYKPELDLFLFENSTYIMSLTKIKHWIDCPKPAGE